MVTPGLLVCVAIVLGTTGALGFYLVSPNQMLRARPLPWRVGAGLGTLCLLASLFCLLGVAGTATSVYLLVTLVMCVWSIVSLVAGWWHYQRSRET